jgi:hypothetical protein
MRLLFIFLFLLPGFVQAARITIDKTPGGRLELRNVVLPDGTEVQYYVITGDPVTIKIDTDEQILIGKQIEIDLTNRLVRIIGYGSIQTKTDGLTEGNDLVFDLRDETFTGRDVLVTTEQIDVIGVDANRVPGQISIQTGRFSPCTRCNQQIEDYGFRAERLLLYPGDRLVGYNVNMVIRDAPVLFFPVLVVPLAALDRQPRLSVKRGTGASAGSRAEIELDWPYVMGADAYGLVGLHYYADIVPNGSNFLGNALLGGRASQSYLGASLEHYFLSRTGDGTFNFEYIPRFSDTEPALFNVKFQYDTDPELNVFQTNLLFNRDDKSGSYRNLTEYKVVFRQNVSGLDASFTSQGFFDLEPEDDLRRPSYSAPLYTYGEFEFKPDEDNSSFSLGGFTVSNILLKLGVFGDSPRLQTADQEGLVIQNAGRLLEQHTITLEPLNPWRGFELSGNSAFTGQYYSTGERAVNWNTTVSARQNFGTLSSLNLSFVRNISEGVSPFQFDNPSENRSIYLEGSFNLTPAPWLSFNTGTRYIFFNQRRSTNIGLDPITSNLNLFGNLNWLELTFQHVYNPRAGQRDSKLTSTFTLSSPEPTLDAALTLTYVKDFIVEGRNNPRDESEFTYEFRYAITPYLTYRMTGGSFAEPATEGEVFKPLELSLTAGTEDQQDLTPSFGIIYKYNYNDSEINEIGYKVTAAAQPIELEVNQLFGITTISGRDTTGDGIPDTPEGTGYQITDARYRVTWNGVAFFEGSGYALIRPFELDPNVAQNWRFSLEDDIDEDDVRFALRYNTTYRPCNPENTDPAFNYCKPSGQRYFENTTLEASAGLTDFYNFGVSLELDFLASWRLRDDTLDRSYLQSLGLEFFTDINGWLGVQGNLGYQGSYTNGSSELSSSQLTITNLAVTFRVTPEVYVSTVFNELWDFNQDNPYNFQPEFRIIWDRCCWALYSSWDTATGEFEITITTPGTDQGFTQAFDSTLKLPGRKLDATP